MYHVNVKKKGGNEFIRKKTLDKTGQRGCN